MKQYFKAESYMALLVAISLFAISFWVYSHWQTQQNHRTHFLYQQQQALQIAENQLALMLAGQSCKRSVSQNNLQFFIECNDRQLKIRFPLGEINVPNP
ncbi:hypothetical protein A1D29_02280 [Pasteurellaceae bacterium Orientalotternb1]|nr:hypothetical protein A1D29_02280 [Pasteurellaceae bacterium Orientalotternb1]